MASLGLLGALGGVGQAMQTAGQTWMRDITQRREAALEDARERAREARRQAERQEDRSFQMQRDEVRADRQERRDEITAKDRYLNREDTQEFLAAQQRGRQEFTREERLARQDHETQLTRLRDTLSRSRTREAMELRRQLEGGDVSGVLYDDVDDQGTSEVLFRYRDGRIVRSGQRVRRRSQQQGQSGTPNL